MIGLSAATGPLDAAAAGAAPGSLLTSNVFLITVDGLRWQEVFRGAELALLNPTNGGIPNTNRVFTDFWRDTPEQRREALLPFFWTAIARSGQLYGNTNAGSVARLTNGRKFTYPGFNELLAGFADDRINKNEKRPNPNVTVLEWLHQKPAFAGRVRAIVNWDVHPYILNSGRSGIATWSGYETHAANAPKGSRLELVQQLFHDITPVWPDMNFDVFYAHAALEAMRQDAPRLVWIALSEPDEWAHEGRYDLYLYAAQRMDRYVRNLWDLAQSLPAYRGRTTLLLTCDHGRGAGPKAWKDHGAAVEGAEYIWIAALGPDTTPLGERRQTAEVEQRQIAATVAALFGEDYPGTFPQAAPAIADIVRRP
jgi:hypothetical protein